MWKQQFGPSFQVWIIISLTYWSRPGPFSFANSVCFPIGNIGHFPIPFWSDYSSYSRFLLLLWRRKSLRMQETKFYRLFVPFWTFPSPRPEISASYFCTSPDPISTGQTKQFFYFAIIQRQLSSHTPGHFRTVLPPQFRLLLREFTPSWPQSARFSLSFCVRILGVLFDHQTRIHILKRIQIFIMNHCTNSSLLVYYIHYHILACIFHHEVSTWSSPSYFIRPDNWFFAFTHSHRFPVHVIYLAGWWDVIFACIFAIRSQSSFPSIDCLSSTRSLSLFSCPFPNLLHHSLGRFPKTLLDWCRPGIRCGRTFTRNCGSSCFLSLRYQTNIFIFFPFSLFIGPRTSTSYPAVPVYCLLWTFLRQYNYTFAACLRLLDLVISIHCAGHLEADLHATEIEHVYRFLGLHDTESCVAVSIHRSS